jgi:hypothetical protein
MAMAPIWLPVVQPVIFPHIYIIPKIEKIKLKSRFILRRPAYTATSVNDSVSPNSAVMPPSPQIGDRLSYDGATCTVRYVGEVAGASGSWLGVEWDDAARGKHDGSHKGVRYFTCESRSLSIFLIVAIIY